MSALPADVEIVRVAERALLVRFHDPDLGRAVARAHHLLKQMKEERVPEQGEVAVGAGSVLIQLRGQSERGRVENLVGRLQGLAAQASAPRRQERRAALVIPVEFGGAAGVDLGEVAQDTGLAEREVVARLCAADLVVAFVGFSPGFPYLIGLPGELEVPRLASPRARVPAGSVAIAGPFAGIYPSATPGGWRILGSTGFALFDPHDAPPATLAAGDQIRLVEQ